MFIFDFHAPLLHCFFDNTLADSVRAYSYAELFIIYVDYMLLLPYTD
jgi:hypothetical protein